MLSRFQQRLTKLGERMKAVNSVKVTYNRTGVGTIANLDATPLYTNQQQIIPGVAITQVHFMDWGVSVADLIFNGTPSKPKIGDTITVNDTGLVFKVVVREGDENPFHYTTSARDRMRIHSDRIA